MTDMPQPERLEKTDDLATDSPWSIEAPKPSNIQFERPDWMLFASVSTLPQVAGVPIAQMRRLVLKELTDNALDAGARVTLGQLDERGNRFFVEDDGPGIEGTPEEIAYLFSLLRPLISSKLGRMPTRGAMGNGLRVVVGAVTASDGWLVVRTRNQLLVLTPQQDGSTAVEAVETGGFLTGTRIEITFGQALPPDPDALSWAEAAVRMAEGGETYRGKPSPHWYDADHFCDMLKAAGKRPVREVIATLDGCSGAKAGQITAAFKATPCNALTRDQGIEVLMAARGAASPVLADRLGKVGKLPTLPPWYAIERSAFMTGGREPKAMIPFLVEAWVSVDPKRGSEANGQIVHVFVNQTPIIEEVRLHRDKDGFCLWGCGLHHMIELPKGRYDITVSIITPYMPTTSQGKKPDLTHFVRQISDAVTKAAKKARRAIPPDRTISIKDAAWKVMEEAYLKASTGGTWPAEARQIMYAARGQILEMTGKPSLNDKYFTQTLLPDFITEHPEMTKDWDVVFDDRGEMIEPHTEVRVPLGTIGVRDYLDRKVSMAVELHTGGILFPTAGVLNRYSGVLFIEKEGFNSLLKAARIAKRFDLAIASTKGMSVTALRRLLDELKVPVYVLHDMDITGRTIFGTLTTDGRRYEFKNNITLYDLGLRYEDVVEMGLESEPFDLGNQKVAKVRETLVRHGASKGEIDMLLVQRRRVELNSTTSDQFVTFVTRRLIECGAKKVIPDPVTLEEAYRRNLVQQQLEREAERLRAKAERDAAKAGIPSDLKGLVHKLLENDPHLSWDRAIVKIQNAFGHLSNKRPNQDRRSR